MRHGLVAIVGIVTAAFGVSETAQAAADSIRYSPGSDAPGAYDPNAGRYSEGASFDPLVCSEMQCTELLHNIFEPLITTSPSGELIPVLATHWQQTDPRTYRFFLRAGVKFHNGEPFDAKAARFSLFRASEIYGATAWFPEIAEINSPEPHVIEVVLDRPDSIFLFRLAQVGLMVPRRHIRHVGVRRFGAAPVGTGPFRFLRWDGDTREIHLEANTSYWRHGFPKIQKLTYVYADKETAYEMLTSGEVDIIRRMNPRRTTEFMSSGAGKVVKAWLPQVVLGFFNLLDPASPLNDLRVRQAINLSINRDHLIRYGTVGNARLVGAYSVPNLPDHAALEPPPHDPATARRLLDEAGYGVGLKISMAVTEHIAPRIENFIATSLQEIGIAVTTQRIGMLEYLEQVYLPKFDEHASLDFDLFLASMTIGTLNHAALVPVAALYSGEVNQSMLRDPAFDALFDTAIAAAEPSAASSAWQDLERYVYDNHLLLFGYQERAIFGVRHGLHFTPRTKMSFWDAYYDE